MKNRALLLLSCVVAISPWNTTQAKTVSAASPSQTDVAAAIALASGGDTIAIPAGTATWNSTLTVSKALSFVGAGIDATTIIVNVPSPGGYAGDAGMVLQGSGYNQVSDLTINGNRLTAFPALTIWGGAATRIHHVKFVDCGMGAYVQGPFGVIDHCQFVNNHLSIRVYGIGTGVQNWDRYYPISFASTNYLFIEDNTFTMNSSMSSARGPSHAFVSAGQGSSYVVRNNTFAWSYHTMAPAFDWHGDNGDGTRGNLSSQIYNNTFTMTGTGWIDKFVAARGGQSLIYNNTVTGAPTYIAYMEEFPGGTVVNGQTVFDRIENAWAWGNTARGTPFSGSCIAGCEIVSYRNSAYSPLVQPPYPHPLVSGTSTSTRPAPPSNLRVISSY